MTKSATGGILVGEGSAAKATVTVADNTTVGDGVSLTTATGDVSIQTTSEDTANADAEGAVNALVGVGISKSETDTNVNSSAHLGSQDVVQAGGNFTLASSHSTEHAQIRSYFFPSAYGSGPVYRNSDGTPNWPIDFHPYGNDPKAPPDTNLSGGAPNFGEGMYSSE